MKSPVSLRRKTDNEGKDMTTSISLRGRSAPLGATVFEGGVNFSLFSRDCAGVTLLLFDRVDDRRPSRTIMLDTRVNRTYHYWHVFVPGLEPGQLYGYRVSGSGELRFNPQKLLFDPYGRAIAVPAGYNRQAAIEPGDNAGVAMKSVVADPRSYDWEGDEPLKRPFSQTVIYEIHVAGFHPPSEFGCGRATSAAPTPAWWKRYPTCNNWVLPPSN